MRVWGLGFTRDWGLGLRDSGIRGSVCALPAGMLSPSNHKLVGLAQDPGAAGEGGSGGTRLVARARRLLSLLLLSISYTHYLQCPTFGKSRREVLHDDGKHIKVQLFLKGC